MRIFAYIKGNRYNRYSLRIERHINSYNESIDEYDFNSFDDLMHFVVSYSDAFSVPVQFYE